MTHLASGFLEMRGVSSSVQFLFWLKVSSLMKNRRKGDFVCYFPTIKMITGTSDTDPCLLSSSNFSLLLHFIDAVWVPERRHQTDQSWFLEGWTEDKCKSYLNEEKCDNTNRVTLWVISSFHQGEGGVQFPWCFNNSAPYRSCAETEPTASSLIDHGATSQQRAELTYSF